MQITSIDEDVEKLEPSDIAGGHAAAALKNSLTVPQRIKHNSYPRTQ